MDAIDMRFKQISKVYHGPEGRGTCLQNVGGRQRNKTEDNSKRGQGVAQTQHPT